MEEIECESCCEYSGLHEEDYEVDEVYRCKSCGIEGTVETVELGGPFGYLVHKLVPLTKAEDGAKEMATVKAPKRSKKMSRPVAVDVVMLVLDGDGFPVEVLMIRRKYPPFQGLFALPGGFVEDGETLEQAAARELEEETGIHIESHLMCLLGTWSEPSRDPRGVISVAFWCMVDSSVKAQLKAGDDAVQAEFISLEDAREMTLAFDHSKILKKVIGV